MEEQRELLKIDFDNQVSIMIQDLDAAHIEILLYTHHIGRLACCADHRPYVVPITYVYQEGYVYGHTNDGMKMEMIRKNPLVCFQADEIKSLSNWRSVIGWGTFEELAEEEADQALSLIANRLEDVLNDDAKVMPMSAEAFEQVLHGIRVQSGKGVFYKIKLKDKSGKFEWV